MFAELGGGDAVHLFEKAREVCAIVETALHGYLANLAVGGAKQGARLV